MIKVLLVDDQTLIRQGIRLLLEIEPDIQVKLAYSVEALRLVVSDDGQPLDAAASTQTGSGLKGLRERIDQLGGDFCCGRLPRMVSRWM